MFPCDPLPFSEAWTALAFEQLCRGSAAAHVYTFSWRSPSFLWLVPWREVVGTGAPIIPPWFERLKPEFMVLLLAHIDLGISIDLQDLGWLLPITWLVLHNFQNNTLNNNLFSSSLQTYENNWAGMFIIHILEMTEWRLTDSCNLLEVTQLVNQDIQPLNWGSISFSLLCNKLPHT